MKFTVDGNKGNCTVGQGFILWSEYLVLCHWECEAAEAVKESACLTLENGPELHYCDTWTTWMCSHCTISFSSIWEASDEQEERGTLSVSFHFLNCYLHFFPFPVFLIHSACLLLLRVCLCLHLWLENSWSLIHWAAASLSLHATSINYRTTRTQCCC